jgi:AcrR family transcriptional regulator
MPPTKAEETRARIVHEATQVISRKGYFHTRIDDVLDRTNLTKGGFYAHFASKEALGHAVIEHATELFVTRVIDHAMKANGPVAQLRALLDGYRRYAVDRTFEGGCFFVNLAIEVDDEHDEFAVHVSERFVQFRQAVVAIVEQGKAQGIFRSDTPSDGLAVTIVGYLTGTMMQAKVARRFELFDLGNPLIDALVKQWVKP